MYIVQKIGASENPGLGSLCQEVEDEGGSVYKVEQQIGEDLHTCQEDSPVFIKGGRRFCFTEEQVEGSVFTDIKCKGPSPPTSSSSDPPTTPSSTPTTGPECQTPACKQFSKRILHSMDPSVEPCEDFHKFACGKFVWRKMSLSELNDIMIDKLSKIIKEPPNPSNPNQDPFEENVR